MLKKKEITCSRCGTHMGYEEDYRYNVKAPSCPSCGFKAELEIAR